MNQYPEYNENIKSVICKNIKKYRKNQKLTQKELAKKCGYSYAYIRRIEGQNCPKNFSILTISNICEALNIDISSIFKDDNI